MDSLDSYQKVSLDIAKYAGDVIKKNATPSVKTKWKQDNTPVTKTDLEINSFVINTIKSYFPDHDILGEEEASLPLNSDFVWVCDPVDGTTPFSHGLKMSTFSLALTHLGKPIVAVVFDPFADELFTTSLDGGSYCNGTRLHVSTTDSLKNTVVNFDSPEWGGTIFEKLIEARVLPCVYQSFIYGAKQVASGHFSGCYFGWNKPYDCAAIKLLIEEAGGKTSDYDGKDQRYDRKLNGFIGSNGHVHNELLHLINSARSEYHDSGKKSRFEFML